MENEEEIVPENEEEIVPENEEEIVPENTKPILLEALAVNSRILSCLELTIKYIDMSEHTTIIHIGDVVNMVFIKNGLVHDRIGKIASITDKFITIDCSEKYKQDITNVQISMVRLVKHLTD